MKTYTGFEYLCIDAANQFGLDKELFEDRIKWVWDNMAGLESLADQAETKPLYKKAVMAIRKAQNKQPSGHAVALDACCSGIQVMSALTGCVVGAENTGLINPERRADAYATLTDVMNEIVSTGVEVPRKKAKMALMTSFYGSKMEPIKIFGKDTEELEGFYKAAEMIAPGAWDLLQVLLQSWRPYALMHQWQLPDGFEAKVKVIKDKESTIEVDELDHATFTYQYKINEGTEFGLSNVANVVHSVDAYVLRSMVRRCNYDEDMVFRAINNINFELRTRMQPCGEISLDPVNEKVAYYSALYESSGMADAVIFPYLIRTQAMHLTTEHLMALQSIGQSMLNHAPFPVITIHDSFAAHPNNLNHLRQHYIDIFAELAESKVLESILNQLYGTQDTYEKLSTNLGELIRGSNYALS